MAVSEHTIGMGHLRLKVLIFPALKKAADHIQAGSPALLWVKLSGTYIAPLHSRNKGSSVVCGRQHPVPVLRLRCGSVGMHKVQAPVLQAS